jgi:hypothetical protein
VCSSGQSLRRLCARTWQVQTSSCPCSALVTDNRWFSSPHNDQYDTAWNRRSISKRNISCAVSTLNWVTFRSKPGPSPITQHGSAMSALVRPKTKLIREPAESTRWTRRRIKRGSSPDRPDSMAEKAVALTTSSRSTCLFDAAGRFKRCCNESERRTA